MGPATARRSLCALLLLSSLAAACSGDSPPAERGPKDPPATQSGDAERRQGTADVTYRLMRRLGDAAIAASRVTAPNQTGIEPREWRNAYQLGFLYGVLGIHYSSCTPQSAGSDANRSYAAGWEKGQRDGEKEYGLLLLSFCGKY